MSKSTLAGHPLHPILITVPAGLLPFSLAMDVMKRASGGRSEFGDAAYYTLVGGVAGGLAAAAAGLADYLKLPKHGPANAKLARTANAHAMLNAGAMALYGLNLLLRRRDRADGGDGSTAVPVAMSAVGTAALSVSAWYGAHLVYEHGVRVRGPDPLAKAPEIKPPGDERAAAALDRAAEAVVPAGGPELR
ncbi:MAG TPA: DUF2231 domain-containing protein [Humisphaera sp.]